jgi:hypothetical protein
MPHFDRFALCAILAIALWDAGTTAAGEVAPTDDLPNP